MKNILLFLISMKLVGISSQVSFYVEPTIQTKTSISSSSFFRISDFDVHYDNRFSFNNRLLILPKKLSPLLLGLNIGVITKNKRNIFNLGINGDESNAGFDYQINSINDFGIPSSTDGSLNTGRSFTNLHFNYKYKLNSQNKQFNWYLVAGFGWALRKKPSSLTFETGVVEGRINDTTNFLMESTNVRTYNPRIFMYNLGLQVDVNSKKGNYLFSTALNYYYSNQVMTYLSTRINIYSNSKSETFYNYNYSTGSGIYLQVSRRIQVYPWKKREKKGV
jgi:hypothetical protein